MTELITADEQAAELMELIVEGTRPAGVLVGDLVDRFERCQRNTAQHWLERAAEAMCERCAKDEPVCYEPDYGIWVHGTRSLSPCSGGAIWKLLPKDPAPAVKRRPRDMTIVRHRAPTNDGTYVRTENPATAGEVKP
jgi:hypothetical protein